MESKTSYADSAICKTLEELRQEVRRALATKADLERRAGSLSASIDAMRTLFVAVDGRVVRAVLRGDDCIPPQAVYLAPESVANIHGYSLGLIQR